LVEGTTGWQRDEAAMRNIVEGRGAALVYGANFSIGVNLFYRIVANAAQLFRGAGYDAFIEEAHHARKRDAPSGTALALQAILSRGVGREEQETSVPIASTRAGHIPGRTASGSTPPPTRSCWYTRRDPARASLPARCSPRIGSWGGGVCMPLPTY